MLIFFGARYISFQIKGHYEQHPIPSLLKSFIWHQRFLSLSQLKNHNLLTCGICI
ncbi:hypothetical protein A225_2725 [Klebsiella michiganensis E718]|nr:hypothetical protein A225_2725 [Klebsiella michiganensis E718]